MLDIFPDALGDGEIYGRTKLFLVAYELMSSFKFLFKVKSAGSDAFLEVSDPLAGVFRLVCLLLRIIS